MLEQQPVEVQQGIWIDARWIRRAGLGSRVKVAVRPGEIRISAAPDEVVRASQAEGWEVLRALGQDAPEGRLAEAAREHDRYLYGKGR